MTDHQPIKRLNVGLDFGTTSKDVGQLAVRDNKIYFEYSADFLSTGLHISPFKLPSEPGLKTFDPFLFEGLPGVFNDSLPDGWGKLLLDRYLKGSGILPSEFSPLDRLAHVGTTGLGALIYEPDESTNYEDGEINLEMLAKKTQSVLEGEADQLLQELIKLNGSSAGARPKALIGVDKTQKHIIHGRNSLPAGYQHWLVKFSNTNDGQDAGAIEYVYSLMARDAGLELTPTTLFAASNSPGYFATKRFDRDGNQRMHMHTASGLLHSDFRAPSLDYEDLLMLTEVLTKDVREVEKMLRLAIFNILSHNRDDHGKNFSFLMDSDGNWKLSPAYDLTFSSGPGGHQSTMVLGKGQNFEIGDLKSLGKITTIDETVVTSIIEEVRDALDNWEVYAKQYNVSSTNIKLIGGRLNSLKK